MTELAPCPLCRHENTPSNRFCGSCGAPLTSGEQLRHAPGALPCPGRSRLALQARLCRQGAGGRRGGPGCRCRHVLVTTQDQDRRVVVAACRLSCRARDEVIGSAKVARTLGVHVARRRTRWHDGGRRHDRNRTQTGGPLPPARGHQMWMVRSHGRR